MSTSKSKPVARSARAVGLVSKASRGSIKKSGFTNQKDYWAKFGVTQSGGSRYESGRAMPWPLAILRQLYDDNIITDLNLKVVRAKVEGRVKRAVAKTPFLNAAKAAGIVKSTAPTPSGANKPAVKGGSGKKWP